MVLLCKGYGFNSCHVVNLCEVTCFIDHKYNVTKYVYIVDVSIWSKQHAPFQIKLMFKLFIRIIPILYT
jgi:hypothetical protein